MKKTGQPDDAQFGFIEIPNDVMDMFFQKNDGQPLRFHTIFCHNF